MIFSRKAKKEYHPPLAFNNNNVPETNSQKHLGVVLDNCLSFEDHLKIILNKVNKTIGLLRKLHNILPRSALLHKSFIRPHFDYGDIVDDQAYNASFHQKVKFLRYNASLAITAAIRDTSREKLYEELGLKSLQLRRWFRKLVGSQIKSKTLMSWSSRKKKESIFCFAYFARREFFFKICFISMLPFFVKRR